MLFRVMYRSHSYLEIKNFKSPVYQFTKVSRLLDPRLFDYTNIRLHEFPRQRTTENRQLILPVYQFTLDSLTHEYSTTRKTPTVISRETK